MIQLGDILVLKNGWIVGQVNDFDKKGNPYCHNSILIVPLKEIKAILRKKDNTWVEIEVKKDDIERID